MAERPQICVSTALVRDGRVLLARRGTGTLVNVWSLPGGRVEWGESLEEAALRELQEEVGVSGKILGIAGMVEMLPGAHQPRHFVIHSYAARFTGGEPRPSVEAPEIVWADLEIMRSLPTTAGLEDVVLRALALAA